MKAYFYILITLIIFTVLMLVYGNGLAQSNIAACDNFDSLYNVVKSGKPAVYNKTAWIEELSLIEKSTISVYPSGNMTASYKVVINIDDINEGVYSSSFDEYSMLEYIVKGCSDFGSKYKNFNKTSCWFVTESPEDILETAKFGITLGIDNKYPLEGSLVNVYNKLCVQEHKPVPVKKPAVYLYPVTPINVSVKVEVNGKLTYTDPVYTSGWNVFAETNGTIDGKYDYLFYEADLNKIELPKEGWVVEFNNLKLWFDVYLPALGLNEKETEQFEEYWLGKLKKAEFYEIRLLDNNFLSDNMRLVVSPEPETVIRLNFHFMPLSVKKDLKEPVIKKTDRKGFTVVEWGGIDAGDTVIYP